MDSIRHEMDDESRGASRLHKDFSLRENTAPCIAFTLKRLMDHVALHGYTGIFPCGKQRTTLKRLMDHVDSLQIIRSHVTPCHSVSRMKTNCGAEGSKWVADSEVESERVFE